MNVEAVNGKAIHTIRISFVLGIGLLFIGIYQMKGSSQISAVYSLNLHASTHQETNTDRHTGIVKYLLQYGKLRLNKKYRSENESNRIYNIMDMKALKFDESYRNPCWRGTNSNGPLADGHIHCLPYFYIIGVKKCGTTDLHARLHHPDIILPEIKESQWMARLRFGINAHTLRYSFVYELFAKGIDVRSIKFFISLFDEVAHIIKLHTTQSKKKNETIYHKMVTGEASPSVLHMHTKWEMLPGNKNLKEPKYTNFHYIKHLTPNAKILIMFRDPVSRLYSDFLHTLGNAVYKVQNTQKLFHQRVITLVNSYTDCIQTFSMRRCVYNNSMHTQLIQKGVELAESFHAGFYAFHMREMLAVFREDQILPIHFSDYTNNMNATLQTVFSFLKLEPLSEREMKRNLDLNIKNNGHYKKKHAEGVLDETKHLLKQFYKPYNEDMANLMNEPKYLFKDT